MSRVERTVGVQQQDRNGVRVRVRKEDSGSVVDAACGCFGIPGRTHTDIRCPRLTS